MSGKIRRFQFHILFTSLAVISLILGSCATPTGNGAGAGASQTMSSLAGTSDNMLLYQTPTGQRLVASFPSGGKIFLKMPEDGAVVDNPWVDVIGTAPPETVISLNDEIAIADENGNFTVRVPLEDGPNEIQCVASNDAGEEADFSFIVVFELPES
jgi:hypothetical protein